MRQTDRQSFGLEHRDLWVGVGVHDLSSACRYADHLVAMEGGRVIAQGPPNRVVTPELVKDLYGVRCTLLKDPLHGTPIISAISRA